MASNFYEGGPLCDFVGYFVSTADMNFKFGTNMEKHESNVNAKFQFPN